MDRRKVCREKRERRHQLTKESKKDRQVESKAVGERGNHTRPVIYLQSQLAMECESGINFRALSRSRRLVGKA